MSLSVTCVCPACFNEIYLGECRILSGKTSGKVLKTPSKGWFSRMHVEPLDGRAYTLELARRECPACLYLLPPNIERVPSITLVVVGDNLSGKSHYIASLIYQLKTEWLTNATGFARFSCLTQDVEQYYIREYFEPLFTQQRVLQKTNLATNPYAKPLIYNLTVGQSRRHPTTEANLIIYDAAGEDFVSEARLVEFSGFVLNTTAFIFVADPFTMTPIFQFFPPDLQDNLRPVFSLLRGSRAAERLSDIISVYERFHKEPKGASLPNTPIAVMVSKSDLFKSFNPPDMYRFMTNPSYGKGIDLQDIDTVDGEVRQLLQKYQQGDLLRATDRFKRLKFFATSSTGAPPDENGQLAHVEPCRCLDPVLWILHQLGIIAASK